MQGKNFLKVTGILMIIGGALTIILNGVLGIVGYMAANSLSSVAGAEDVNAAVAAGGSLLIVAAIISLVGGILELIAGIIGVKNCAKPEKATTCIVWGFIVLVINIISLILAFAGGSETALNIITSIIASIALPVLYLIGGFLNKKSANVQ